MAGCKSGKREHRNKQNDKRVFCVICIKLLNLQKKRPGDMKITANAKREFNQM